MNPIRALIASFLLVAASTSCVAPKKAPEEKDANGKKIEYVYYTPAGSNIPIKVRKDQLQDSDDDSPMQRKLMDDMQRGAAGPPQDPGGK